MKRYMVLLTCLILLFALPTTGNAQNDTQTITTEIVVHFPGFDRTGTYSGESLNGVPHGQGAFTASNDEGVQWTYTGHWSNGAMDGEGSTVWTDGSEENGHYVQNVLVTGQTVYDGVVLYDGSYAWYNEAGGEVYDGEGKLYNNLGRLIWEGQFSLGCLIENAKARKQRADALAPLCKKLTKADYDSIIKNEVEWIGKMIQFDGDVTHIWEKDTLGYGEFEVCLNSNDSRPMDVYYRYGIDEKRVKQGQDVTVYGTITGVYRYDDDTGNPYVAPLVEAEVILRK